VASEIFGVQLLLNRKEHGVEVAALKTLARSEWAPVGIFGRNGLLADYMHRIFMHCIFT
jgi:hypothetical protein